MLLAPDSQSLETALLVLDQVARKWAMSVNYDKAIGVVVTPPPTAATQGDQPAAAVTTTAPPRIQVGSNRRDPRPLQVPGQHHARERGAGPGDPDQYSQPGVQVPQKVSFHFQPRGLELQTALLLPGALTPHVRDSRVMGPPGLPGSQAAQLETTTPECAA